MKKNAGKLFSKPIKRKAITAVIAAAIGSVSLIAISAPPAKPQIAATTGRIIVKFKPKDLPRGMSAQQVHAEMRKPFSEERMSMIRAKAKGELRYVRASGIGSHVLAVGRGASKETIAQMVADLRQLGDIEYVEEERRYFPRFTPNDSRFNDMPNLKPVTAGNFGADFQTAWDTTKGDPSIVVAVVDTGILPHPDLVGQGGTVSPAKGNLVSPGFDFIDDCRRRGSCPADTADKDAFVAPSPNATDLGDFVTADDLTNAFFTGCNEGDSRWHGTHVSGTVGALGNNGLGVIGGAFGAKILPVRALGKCGGVASDINDGMLWAAGVHPTIPNPNPARVINLSLGGVGPCTQQDQETIDAIISAGVVVVVAAGNANKDANLEFPGNCKNVITVAATAQDGAKASYSNFSTTLVSLAAPGGDTNAGQPGILSTLNSGTTNFDPNGFNFVVFNGTSMAAPHVAASVALMLSRNPALSVSQVKTIITAPNSVTAFPAGSDCAQDKFCGSGILNANLAVKNSFTPLTASPATFDFGNHATGTNTTQSITFTNNSTGSIKTGATQLSGAGSTAYQLGANTCNTVSLQPGNSCSVSVTFSPTATGAAAATLSVPTTATGANTTTNVGLTGAGVAAGVGVLATPSATVTASTVNVNQTTTVTVPFTNSGTAPLTVGAVSLTNAAVMAISANTCSNTTLAPTAGCNVTVTVTPTQAGSYTGTLTANTNPPAGSPTTVTISGQATAPTGAPPTTAPPAETPQQPSPGTGNVSAPPKVGPAAFNDSDGKENGGGGGGCAIGTNSSVDPTLIGLVLMAASYLWRRRKQPSLSKQK